uniref:Doublecortin domain-containing protein n=1 Tax=Astyanax mexicanus TaxID=7994 RepID=A0A3B1IU90_ASTMX
MTRYSQGCFRRAHSLRPPDAQSPPETPAAPKECVSTRAATPSSLGTGVVINSRTFKTFDALLDALSKKVPLPFGVRTITTPKGTHTVRSLDDLRDGASYVCSDQKKVKPLNLEEVNRRQVPWNTTRPTSAGRHGRRGLIRQLMKKNEVRRAAKAVDRFVAVWTPKKLVVYKNRDPSTKRTIVLQRRTAPTFEALLDYLSQVLQFTVVKLYTEDGRRVDGLPALIMCSGIVVAAGNEPFWMGNYNLQGSSQLTQSDVSESIEPANTQALPTKKKTPSSRSRSRNFSLSSEKYFVEQINKSLNGSLMSGDDGQKTGSMETDNNQSPESEGVGASDCVADIKEKGHFTMPSEDDIEKSFCVNQDGSMTVEMKVRLTIKHEEMIHWTTTLSRTCTDSQQRAVCSQTGSNCPENNHYLAKEAKSDNCESSEENTSAKKSVGINKAGGDHCGSATSEALDKPKPALRRLPTPGPRRVRRKEASVENIKMVSQHEVQESTVGAYSYMERTADGELTEGYCVVSRSSSSSTRPVPKPRKSSSGEAKHKKTSSSVRSSRTAEVLQLQNNGTQITETVMHIYESQGMCENYFANTQVSAEKSLEFRASAREARKPDSSDSGPRSSSNDCDVDITRQSTSSDSQNAKMKNELLSLSSDQSSPSQKINNNLNSRTNSERRTRSRSSHKGLEAHEACTKDNPEVKSPESRKAGITPKSVKSKEGTSSDTSVSDKKQKGGSVPGSLKDLRKSKSPGSQSHTGSEKKTVSSAESEKMGQKVKKKMKEKQLPRSNLGSQNGSSETLQNLDNAGSQKSLKNVNKYDSVTTRDSLKSPIKKKHLEVLQPSHLAPARMLTKPKSMHECRRKSSEKSKEFTESSSMPVLCSSPTNVHQYVENWLKKIQPESLPYLDEMDPPEAETEAKPKFWIGSGSAESSEIRSEPEQDSVVKDCASLEDATTETPVPHTPVQIRCEGDPVEAQRIRGFCKSMPSVRIHPAEQETQIRMNKSSQALVNIQPDAEGETSESSKVSVRSGVKPVLQQLCLSIQSIRRTSSHSNITTLDKEKSSSLPDFSSQVSSVFGAPSKALLSFLSLMTLKDGVSSPGNEDRLSNSGSYPEALQVMQSLEKISNIDDEEELKASLTSLQSSTSSKLKKSWRDFQERNDTEGSPPLSPKFSEQEFALEVDSEGEDHDKEHNFGIQELMDELDMSEDLRKEISSLVDGEQTSSDQEKTAKKHSNNENTDVVSENEDATTKDDFLEGEAACSEEKASQDDITGVKEDAEELHRVESCPPEAADPSNDLVKEESEVVEDVQTAENETFQTDPLIDELNMEDNVPTTEEKDTEAITCQDNEPIQNNSEEEKKEEENEEDAKLLAYTSVTEGADEVVSEHHSEVNIGEDCETEKNEDESVDGDIRKTDLDEKSMNAAMSEAEHSEHSNREECEMDENQEAKHQTSNFVPEGDSLLNEEVNMSNDEEQNNDMLKSEDAETQHQEPSPVNGISVCESHNSNDSEVGNEKLTLESPSNEHNHDVTIGEETENTTDLHDALECSADDTDQDIDHNSPLEDEPDRDNEDIISKASECEADNAESHHSSISGQEGGHSDKNEKGSYQSQESESEQNDFRTFEEERDIEKQVSSAEEKCVESDEHEDEQTNALGSENDADSELESNNPALSDMEGEHPDQKERSCKSQESEVEHNPQMSEEERFSEKLTSSPREKGEVEAQHCNALDSEEDNGDQSDQDQPQSCRSKESEVDHDLQASEEGNVTEENEEDIEEHEDKLSIALDSNKDFDAEPEASDSAMSDQDGEQSDQDKEQTCKSQESVDHEHQTLEEGNVSEGNEEEVHKPENEMCNISDSDKYFDVQTEEKDSVISDEDGEQSEQDKALSCKSQESEVDRDFQTPEEDNVTEGNEEEIDEPKNEQCTVSGTDKECNAQTEEKGSVMSDEDGEQSEQDKAQSCKSQESEVDHEHQTLEEGNVSEGNEEEVDEPENEQCNVSDSDKDYNVQTEEKGSVMFRF